MIGTSLLCRAFPRAVWRHRIKSWHIETGEAEQELLPTLCNRKRISLDIGAAAGTYTARMLLYSSRVIAFEPNPGACEALHQQFRHTGIVTVEQIALSDISGVTNMRIPPDRPMLGTIEPGNPLSETDTVHLVPVRRKRLDDYGLRNVGFLKIDTEGHEIAILDGGADTIRRERPKFIIEIDQVNLLKVREFFAILGYSGHFLLDGELVGIDRFDALTHQNRDNLVRGRRVGCYISNFVFLPS